MKKTAGKIFGRCGLRDMTPVRRVQVALAVAALLVSAAVMGQRQANILAAASGLSFNPQLMCQMPGETAASLKKELAAKQAALAAAKKKLAANAYTKNSEALDKIQAYTEKNLAPLYAKIEAAQTEASALKDSYSSTAKSCPSKRAPGDRYPTTTWCRYARDYVYTTTWATSTEGVAAKKKYDTLSATVAKLQKQAAPHEAQVQKMEAARQKIVYPNGAWDEYFELPKVIAALPAEIDAINSRIRGFSLMKPCPTTETQCENKIDEDLDGATDCADADCASGAACKKSDGGGGSGGSGGGGGGGGGNGGGGDTGEIVSCCVGYYDDGAAEAGTFKAECQQSVDSCTYGAVFKASKDGTQSENARDYCDGFFGGREYDTLSVFYCGHSDPITTDPDHCDPDKVVEQIILDVSISGDPIPKAVTYFNSGCSTFSDLGAARGRAEELADFLRLNNYGGTVLLAGYQNPSCTGDPSVGGKVIYKICTTGVTEAFDLCPARGADCYYSNGGNGDTSHGFTCVDESGQQMTATCAQKPECASDPESCRGTYDGTITY